MYVNLVGHSMLDDKKRQRFVITWSLNLVVQWLRLNLTKIAHYTNSVCVGKIALVQIQSSLIKFYIDYGMLWIADKQYFQMWNFIVETAWCLQNLPVNRMQFAISIWV